jgi:hypothetical protein
MDISQLKENPDNPQSYTDLEIDNLIQSINDFPKMMKLRPIVYDPATMYVLGGNKRLKALHKAGYKELPDDWVKSADELTKEEKHRFIVQDNIQHGSWDYEMLSEKWDKEQLREWGMDLGEWTDEEMPEELEGDYDNSQNPNDVYGGNSIPMRIATLMGYIKDEQMADDLAKLAEKINEQEGDGEQAQKRKNEICYNIGSVILDNEDSILL